MKAKFLLWEAEFGADYAVPSAIATHPKIEDTSWHNDVCPSFTTPALFGGEADVRLWVEHPDPAQREYDVPRYRVVSSDGNDDVFFEHETDVEAALAALFAVPVPVDPRAVAVLAELSRVLQDYNAGQIHAREALFHVKGVMHRLDTGGEL